MRHAIPISGKDSLCTALVQRERVPEYEYEYFYNETGAELPETSEWLLRAEAYLGKSILRIGDNLEDIISDNGILPSMHVRFCTRQAKIEPTEHYFKADDVTIYYGLRADEPKRNGYERRSQKGNGIVAAYPLREAGYTLAMVWARLKEIDLLPPSYFWVEIYDRVIRKLGSQSGIIDNLKPWEYNQVFAWRTRDNCYYCFFQRLYEWVGLYDNYPELFWHAVDIEESTGAKGFNFNSRKSLREILTDADRIREDRANKIVKLLYKTTHQSFFDDESISLMDTISCGLLCGK